jgi:hypothetical protein
MLEKLSDDLMEWMISVSTNHDLNYLITAFIQGRGGIFMEELCWDLHPRLIPFAQVQDQIGWHLFLEGMIATELRDLQLVLGLEGEEYLAI